MSSSPSPPSSLLAPFVPRPKNCKVDLALPLARSPGRRAHLSLRHNRRNQPARDHRDRERDPQSLHKITTDRVCTIWIPSPSLSLSLSLSPSLAALNFRNKERFRNNWQPSGSDAAEILLPPHAVPPLQSQDTAAPEEFLSKLLPAAAVAEKATDRPADRPSEPRSATAPK